MLVDILTSRCFKSTIVYVYVYIREAASYTYTYVGLARHACTHARVHARLIKVALAIYISPSPMCTTYIRSSRAAVACLRKHSVMPAPLFIQREGAVVYEEAGQLASG